MAKERHKENPQIYSPYSYLPAIKFDKQKVSDFLSNLKLLKFISSCKIGPSSSIMYKKKLTGNMERKDITGGNCEYNEYKGHKSLRA